MAQTPRCPLDGGPYEPPFGDCAIYSETNHFPLPWLLERGKSCWAKRLSNVETVYPTCLPHVLTSKSETKSMYFLRWFRYIKVRQYKEDSAVSFLHVWESKVRSAISVLVKHPFFRALHLTISQVGEGLQLHLSTIRPTSVQHSKNSNKQSQDVL